MRQPFLLKAAVMHVLDKLPYRFHSWVSARITGRNVRKVGDHLPVAQWHLGNYQEWHIQPEDLIVEFGAGQDLLNCLICADKGFINQQVIDISAMVSADKLNGILGQLASGSLPVKKFDEDFYVQLRQVGIDYRAPSDMRATGLESGSVAAVTSTNTLEHIPAEDIKAIMLECHRVLRDDGICSFKIDYSDHYAHTDPSITIFNFLKYSERTWRWMSPSNHYQNRLRHKEFIRLFKDAGFCIKSEEEVFNETWQSDLASVSLDKKFQQFSPAELGARAGLFVLTKSSPDSTS